MIKYILIVLSIFISISTFAQTTYYVDGDGQGSDLNTGLDSTTNPLATLAYAATLASATDTIFFMAGTHTITAGVEIPIEVSLRGVDSTNSIIYCNTSAPYTWAVIFYSSIQSVNGNQIIKNLRFIGNGFEVGSDESDIQGAIYCENRNNIKIFECAFANHDDNAVTITGDSDAVEGGTNDADHWVTGIEVYNNSFINSCKRQAGEFGWNTGALQIGATDSCLIHNNFFDETTNSSTYKGYNIKYYNAGFNRFLKIYDNVLLKPGSVDNAHDWSFAIELWYYLEGTEIYNNRIQGGIDVDHVVNNGYDYGVSIHDNNFGHDSPPTTSGVYNHNNCIYIEFSCEDVYIYNNYVQNMELFIQFDPREATALRNINIHHNVIHSLTDQGDDYDNYLIMITQQGNYTAENIRFENNTIYGGGTSLGYGLNLNGVNGTFQSVFIQNNIFVDFDYFPITVQNGSWDTLYIRNNVYYANGTNAPEIGVTPTNLINSGGITSDPLFTNALTDLSITTSSPAKDAGLDLGYNLDYLDNSIYQGAAPDIGAYEFQETDSTATEILTFTIVNQVSSVVTSVDSSVIVTMPFGTDVTGLTPTITLSPLATVSPLSGVSQNFTSEVAYTVTANKGNSQEWGVSVLVEEDTTPSTTVTYLKNVNTYLKSRTGKYLIKRN